MDVAANLRRDAGHAARLFMADEDLRETSLIAAGHQERAGFRSLHWRGQGAQKLVLSVECENRDGCPQTDEVRAVMRNVRLTLEDLGAADVRIDDATIAVIALKAN